MSTNTTGSRLPTHKNLKDRIAALQRLNQQGGSPSTSPNPSATSPSPEPSLSATQPNTNGNNNAKVSLRDKIARFEAAGGTPIPRGSFGMGPMPHHEDDVSRRKGEMLGNRVPGLNRPAALPTDGLGMTSKSHLTVKPIAKNSAHRHNRGESQSLGSNHRRFTSYSNLTSPTLTAYDGEGGAELSEVDEFGGLYGLDRPQTSLSLYSPTLTPQSLPSPELTASDKLPGRIAIPDKFQRRVVSDFQASYGITRALTPDPEMALEQLDEDVPLSSSVWGSPRPEAEPIPDSQADDDPKGPEVQPPTELPLELSLPTEPTPDVQSPPSTAYLPPPTDPSQKMTAETVPELSPEPILVVDVAEDDMTEDSQSIDADVYTQLLDHAPEVSKTNPPLASVADCAAASPPTSPRSPTPSTPGLPADPLPAFDKDEETLLEPSEELFPSPDVVRESDDALRPEKTYTPPTLASQPSPTNSSPIENAPSELQTPPETPRPSSSASTSTSDLSDSGINYQSGSDPDDDLFVLPLPKDDELPPRSIVKEVAVPQSVHRAFVSPPPTLQPPIDFPVMATKSVPSTPSDPNISLTADESLALDASQAEIVIAQSEVISPASPTLFVAMPSPSPTTTAFRMQTPPLPEETLPSPEGDDTQVSPPRIRKKLYTNHTVPTSFRDTLLPPPSRRSFSAVVHQRNTVQTSVPDRVDSVTPKPSHPANSSMTPKKKQGPFAEPATPASPSSDLAFLVQHAAILEAQLSGVGDLGGVGLNRPGPAEHSVLEPPRSMLRSDINKVKSASTPTLVSSSVTTPGHLPPVPDLVYDDGSSNSGLSSAPRIPPFLPQFRSRKSGPQEEVDRKSLAPSYKSRKSEKSAKEKDKDPMPRARKLSSRLRSLASASTNSLRSLSRPSLSSDTSVSFDSPTTVSIEPMTPQDTGSGESGRVGSGIGSPGSRSQISQGSGSEWGSPPRRRDVLGRASSFADRLISRVGKSKSGFLDSSQGSSSSDYLSPMRANTVSSRKTSRDSQRGTSKANDRYGTSTSQAPRIELPFFGNEDVTRTPLNNPNSTDYLSANLRTLPSIPLTPSTPDTSSFFDSTELFDAFPSVPQNLPRGPGSSLLSGFELRTNSDLGLGGGLGKAATISSSHRPRTSQSYR